MENLLLKILVGIITTVVPGYLLYKFFGIGKNDPSKVTNTHIGTVNNFSSSGASGSTNAKDGMSSTAKAAFYKETSKILFIDNSSMKEKIQNLNKAGWKNVKQIYDVDNIDSGEIREAGVIFVDYKGIGGAEKEQGLAVLEALNNRYKDSKWLILFTAYEVPVTAFQKGANDYLAKNSTKYEVEQKIIKGLENLSK